MDPGGEENLPSTGDDEILDEPAMIIYKNPEKRQQIRLGAGEYMPKVGDRILLSSLPGGGKRVLTLNIINRINPKYLKAIHIVHSDPNTIEYDCLGELGAPIYVYGPEDLPTLENIENPDLKNDSGKDDSGEFDMEHNMEHEASHEKSENEKTPSNHSSESENEEDDQEQRKKIKKRSVSVIVIDECPASSLKRIGNHRMERIVNHMATHKDCLVICCIQNLLNLSPSTRRGFNNFGLWKQYDLGANQMAASRAGISYEMLKDMFELCKSKYDFIFIDLDRAESDPMRYRLNWFYPITIEEAFAPTEEVEKEVAPPVEAASTAELTGGKVVVDPFFVDSKGKVRPKKVRAVKKSVKTRRIRGQ